MSTPQISAVSSQDHHATRGKCALIIKQGPPTINTASLGLKRKIGAFEVRTKTSISTLYERMNQKENLVKPNNIQTKVTSMKILIDFNTKKRHVLLQKDSSNTKQCATSQSKK